MNRLAGLLASLDTFSSESVEADVKAWLSKEELPFGKVMPGLRLAIVGDLKGPHLFDILALLGKEETIGRIQKAIETLQPV
jgi:glutamyl-tRNA synthetase